MEKLGKECMNKLMELNPRGGMSEFIRIAVEFGYKRAVNDNIKSGIELLKLFNEIESIFDNRVNEYVDSYEHYESDKKEVIELIKIFTKPQQHDSSRKKG